MDLREQAAKKQNRTIRICQITAGTGAMLLGLQLWMGILARYNFENSYLQLWELADKSSTIQAKQDYISQFLAALQTGKAKGEFSEHNAVWLKTPNNSLDRNLTALSTLSGRLSEIQEMKPSSFEYNAAIQQITQQEQGGASAMMDVFSGCYKLKSYPIVWEWIGKALSAIWLVSVFIAGGRWFTVATE